MIDETIENIKKFFYTNKTKDICFRIEQLKKLKNAIIANEKDIIRALKKDLKKPDFEIYSTEITPVIEEINLALKNIKNWAKEEKVLTPLYLQPAQSRIIKEPYGVVLIIIPFNYPFQLGFTPLIGAIAAGNCAVLRPSRRTPYCARVIYNIILETFKNNYVKCYLPEEISPDELTEANFDYIFFTGSTESGRKTYKNAAKNLTPCTLELGGKSPVIVDKDVDIQMSADRIVQGKFLNCAQTCIAPDYVAVDYQIKGDFIVALCNSIKKFYSTRIEKSKDYSRLIDRDAFLRLKDLIEKEKNNILSGGHYDEEELYIEPVILEIDSFNSPVMKEEIFGPLLPVIAYEDIEDIIYRLRTMPKPLALYVFSRNKVFSKNVISALSFGGGCVNETLKHAVSPLMPFGGIGASGLGKYHGKYSFDTFTHLKSLLIRNFDADFINMSLPHDVKQIEMIKKKLDG